MQKESLNPETKVLIVDDLLATGGKRYTTQLRRSFTFYAM